MHHKSGTLAGMHLVSSLCCEAWQPDCAKDREACGFWGAWANGCRAGCHAQGVDFAYMGWWGSWSPANPRTVVHFLRHPVDMVVSHARPGFRRTARRGSRSRVVAVRYTG